MTVAEQVVVIYAGTKGYLDGVAVNEVSKFEHALLESLRANGKDILDGISKDQKIDGVESNMKEFLGAFAANYVGATQKAA